MSAPRKPVAWMFVRPDGRVRFILHDKARADAWATAHEGEIVPLYRAPTLTDDERASIEWSINDQIEGGWEDHETVKDVLSALRGLLERTK